MYKFITQIIFVSLLLGFTSCAKKITFPVSNIAPAAQAFIKVKQDKNNNYQIDLKANYLADPERLNPPKKVYVLWMVTDDNKIINMGQLKSKASQKASMSMVTSFKPKQVIVTAEDDADIEIPGEIEIFRTKKFKP